LCHKFSDFLIFWLGHCWRVVDCRGANLVYLDWCRMNSTFNPWVETSAGGL
jgi:hypothetical protein